ncbi:hypothetical protein [Nocardia sp. NPDC049149]|uniref:hypothetical protein n=1 Tax=Nocardia sp. NPDC049149 TaxID=3364315 RepID=UPI00371F89F7
MSMITTGRATRSTLPRRLAAAVLTTGLLGLGVVSGAAHASPGADCLWAGAAHAPGSTVVAGGWEFTCGYARWLRGPRTDARTTVTNPGAKANPRGRFSAGALQPGTDYTDYCVGDQLIDGRDDIFEVMQDGNGSLWWKAAGPISGWHFDGTTPPPVSWRRSSLCRDGELI